MIHLGDNDLVRRDLDLVFEELLAVLLVPQSRNVSRFDTKEDAAFLGHWVAFALNWVYGKEVLAEVVGHDNVLTKNLVELLIILVVVLQSDFL